MPCQVEVAFIFRENTKCFELYIYTYNECTFFLSVIVESKNICVTVYVKKSNSK